MTHNEPCTHRFDSQTRYGDLRRMTYNDSNGPDLAGEWEAIER